MSSNLYRSAGGAIKFYARGGEGVKEIASRKIGLGKLKLPVWAWALIVLGIILLIMKYSSKINKMEGFGQFIPGGQTGSGFAGTFTLHRSQHSPRNRTVDDQLQLQDMRFDTGDIATGHVDAGFKSEAFADRKASVLDDALKGESFSEVDSVPAGQSVVPIPASGQANPGRFRAGFADFSEGFGNGVVDCGSYGTSQAWNECRLQKKKEGFSDPILNESGTMGFLHILPEDDYVEGGADADKPGHRQQVGFMNPRVMGSSVRPFSQRLVEGYEDSYDILKKQVGAEGYANYNRAADMSGDMPLTALQKKVLMSEGMSSPPNAYSSGLVPSSFQRRNMLSGQPNSKARAVISNYCKHKAKQPCKKDPLCNWSGNDLSCEPARRAYNTCAFPVNPKYRPVDPKTGMKNILASDACIDEKDSNFNKWVETNWVLRYEKPYASMKQSDLYYKQLKDVVYHNPKAWDVKKFDQADTSIKPGAVQAFADARKAPVGVDDTVLEIGKKEGKPMASGKKEGFSVMNTVRDYLGL